MMNKRQYNGNSRQSQAKKTKDRILNSAKLLFESQGFDGVTIELLAKQAEVSAPTIYSLFKSKTGVLKALMDTVLDQDQFEDLVQKASLEKNLSGLIKVSAHIAAQMYDAEKALMNALRGASALNMELKNLEKEQEKRRYERQERTLKIMFDQNEFKENMPFTKARDILWAMTGRDLFRLLVIDRGWSVGEYEEWLAESLIQLLQKKFVHRS